MTYYEWSKKELKEISFPCNKKTNKLILKILKVFSKKGHSIVEKTILQNRINRLLDHKPLTAITEENADWAKQENNTFQSRKYPTLFKIVHNDGTITYRDVDRTTCYDGKTYWEGSDCKIIDEMFPITLPYYPPNQKFKLRCEEFLYDEKEGDYDTKGYLYVITPSDEVATINKYYKFIGEDRFEITKDEYEQRKIAK